MSEIGIAKRLFLEKRPKKNSDTTATKNPAVSMFLEKLLATRCLDYIDYILAQKFADGLDESVAVLIAYLSLASRQGHLCVNIEGEEIQPSPANVLTLTLDDRDNMISFDDITTFHSHILKGAMLPISSCAPIVRNGHDYYLQRFWHLETEFIHHLKIIFSENIPRITVDMQKIMESIDALKLLPEQKAAIILACTGTLTLITGGPGTGKTYTAGMLLRMLWQGMSPEQQQHCQIEIAAPTGKAAANIDASIRKINTDSIPIPSAKTLHQLLKINKFTSKSANVLSADIILVDECSMIDVHLMGELLASVKPGARLILLGDKDQLPSVEAGSLFADMADYLLASNERKSYIANLKTCLRAESQQILQLSENIKCGDVSAVMELLAHHDNNSTSFVALSDELSDKEQQQRLIKHALQFFQTSTKISNDPLRLLEDFSKFRLLSPMRKGPLGVDQLNAAIFQALNSKTVRAGCHIIPIMITHNDYRLELFNGEVGLLVSELDGNKQSSYAIFASRQSGESTRKIPALMLPRFEHAYCLSVHKSQGSEFNHVLLVLPKGSEAFGRAALYTGATRARKQLEIWGSPAVVSKMLVNVSRRQSGIGERLLLAPQKTSTKSDL